jgi:hypothetical protein
MNIKDLIYDLNIWLAILRESTDDPRQVRFEMSFALRPPLLALPSFEECRRSHIESTCFVRCEFARKCLIALLHDLLPAGDLAMAPVECFDIAIVDSAVASTSARRHALSSYPGRRELHRPARRSLLSSNEQSQDPGAFDQNNGWRRLFRLLWLMEYFSPPSLRLTDSSVRASSCQLWRNTNGSCTP